MVVRLRHTLGFLSLVAVYAPTEVRDLKEKETFYARLDSVVYECPRRDTLLVLGDFNACVGADRAGYESCLGPHGAGARNCNGSLLLDFAKSWRLRVAGSWFQRPDLHRWSWISNAGNAEKELDHVLVSSRWKLVQNCRVFRSAEFFSTDHRLVVATLRICLRSRKIQKSGLPRLDLERLKDPNVSAEFAAKVSERLDRIGNMSDPDRLWEAFKRGTLDAAGVCIPVKPRRKNDFVTTETREIIEASRAARLNRTGLHRQLRRQARAALGSDKERWVRGIAEEVEKRLFSSGSQPAYQALKRLRSKPPSRVISVKTADGRVLTDPDECRTRWAEYFQQLFVAAPPATQLNTSGIAIRAADPPISTAPPSLEEVRMAVGGLKSGKAVGICGIAGEMLKSGGPDIIGGLHSVLVAVWESGIIPTDWRQGLVVPIWKGKGDRLDCNNYRGVTLLSVPGKVLARLLLSRIRSHLLLFQRPEQSGFTPKKSTIDRILALRVLIERRLEFRQRLLAAYVDLKKAFDSVHRESLWEILRIRGIPAKIIDLISALYSNTVSAVKCGGPYSDSFPVNSGVRQGCVLAPTLFNACMDWVLGRVADRGLCRASIGEAEVTDLDFADDAALLAESLDNLVEALEALEMETRPLGLQVSWTKTKVQSFDDCLAGCSAVSVCGESVEVLDRFTYLGSVIQSSGGSDLEVDRRLGLSYGVMESLNQAVWRCRYLSKRTKIQVFKVLVLPVMLYGAETWTLTASLETRLNAFVTKSLRRILGYRWNDFVSNHRLLQETGVRLATCLIRERKLRFFGHMARLPTHDPVYQVLSAKTPATWKRPRGRPRATWLNQIDGHCRELGIGRELAWGLAKRDPAGWRSRVNAATRCFGVCSHT
jgi:sorting nexin-29